MMPESFDLDMTGSVSVGKVLWRQNRKQERGDRLLPDDSTTDIHYRLYWRFFYMVSPDEYCVILKVTQRLLILKTKKF